MSNLEKYIDELNEYIEKNNLSELEIIRYVYMDFGQRFSFDLDFAFGNAKTKKEIYGLSKTNKGIEKALEINKGLCTTFSYILNRVLKQRGIDIFSITEDGEDRKYPHMHNVIRLKDYEPFMVDLQMDLENIQSHSMTKFFGLSIEKDSEPVIDRLTIENMDRKLGFVDKEHYYADEYIYLLKQYMGYCSTVEEKIQFVIENLEAYENPNMEYAERTWHHEKLLKSLFTEDEMRKIHQIDCYRDKQTEEGTKREYQNCIVVDVPKKGKDIYLYSKEENRYKKMSMQEFAKEVQGGLVNIEGIYGLKAEMRKLREKNKEEEER